MRADAFTPTRYFAFGEYSHALRLKSELFDLRAANANRFRRTKIIKTIKPPSAVPVLHNRMAPPNKSPHPVGATRYFAFGEYSHALRLKSELFDLRAANANRFRRTKIIKTIKPPSAVPVLHNRMAPPNKSPHPVGATRYFAFGEYSHALRLKSELFDLRAANANRFRRTKIIKTIKPPSAVPVLHNRMAPPNKSPHPVGWRLLFGGATRNRTGDEGFADLCLTAWLWRHILSLEKRARKANFVPV